MYIGNQPRTNQHKKKMVIGDSQHLLLSTDDDGNNDHDEEHDDGNDECDDGGHDWHSSTFVNYGSVEQDSELQPRPAHLQQKQQAEHHDLVDDIIDTFRLGLPIFISSASWVGKKTTDTALLGHVGSKALSAAALSDLWTTCSLVLLQGRVLTILVGNAVGSGNPKLGGVYLQVSGLVMTFLSIAVISLWNMTEYVWLWLGTSETDTIEMAGYYSRVLSMSIPAIVVYVQLLQFFSAQRIMYPGVYSSVLGFVANLLFGLLMVVGWPIPKFDGYGFVACPVVTMGVTYMQLVFFLFYYIWLEQLHLPCWPGWKFSEITWERMWAFMDLYFPSALSAASDYWRVAIIGLLAASMGEVEVAVYNTSYRIIWITLTLTMALSAASGINISLRLGQMDPIGAKQAGFVCVGLTSLVSLILSCLIFVRSRWFGMIFTTDADFLDLFEEARIPFILVLFFTNLSISLERIPFSMGRTREVFFVSAFASWLVQVPFVFFLTRKWKNDLVGLYSGMAIGYAILVLLYLRIVLNRCVSFEWIHVSSDVLTRDLPFRQKMSF